MVKSGVCVRIFCANCANLGEIVHFRGTPNFGVFGGGGGYLIFEGFCVFLGFCRF